MVQAFLALGMTELDAFRAFAETYPDDCVLLVDTIDTLGSGIPNAIKVFEELKRKGHTPVGIRLDSGDLAHLSIQAVRMLNEAGFPDTTIVLSNELDRAQHLADPHPDRPGGGAQRPGCGSHHPAAQLRGRHPAGDLGRGPR
jgi:nicotinic acid phosphoribosyltransferase